MHGYSLYFPFFMCMQPSECKNPIQYFASGVNGSSKTNLFNLAVTNGTIHCITGAGLVYNTIMRNQGRLVDKTFLNLDVAEERGLIHRDFL